MLTLLTLGLVSNILSTADIGMETIGAIWKKRKQEEMLNNAFVDAIEKEKTKLKKADPSNTELENRLDNLKAQWKNLKIKGSDIVKEEWFIGICQTVDLDIKEAGELYTRLKEKIEERLRENEDRLRKVGDEISATKGLVTKLKKKIKNVSLNDIIRNPVHTAFDAAVEDVISQWKTGDEKRKEALARKLKGQWKTIRREMKGQGAPEFNELLERAIFQILKDKAAAENITEGIYNSFRANLKTYARENEKAFYWHVVDTLSDMEKENAEILEQVKALNKFAGGDYGEVLKIIGEANIETGKRIDGLEETIKGELTRIEKELLAEHERRRKEHETIMAGIESIPEKVLSGLKAGGVKPQVKIQKVPLQTIPNIKNFVGRQREIDEIRQTLKDHGFVVIEGIPGIGKTYIGSRIARSQGLKPLWINLETSGGFDTLIQQLAQFFKNDDRQELFDYLNSGEANRELIINHILQSLINSGLFLFFDNLHSVKDEDMQELFRHLYTNCEGANIILITRRVPDWIPEALREDLCKKIKGFMFKDAVKILKKLHFVKEEEYERIWNETSGHPVAVMQYVTFLKKGKRNILENLVNRGDVHELFEQQYLSLSNDAKEILHLISVFNEDVQLEGLYQIVKNDRKVDTALDEIEDWNLIEQVEGKVIIHDLFREFTYWKEKENKKNHIRAFKYYSNLEENPANIMKAYYHLDNAGRKIKGIDYLLNRHKIFEYRGYWREFADTLKEAAGYLEKRGKKEKLGTVYGNLGYILSSLGNYDAALQNFEKALKIFEELGAQSEAATLLNNIGLIYNARSEYESALQYFEKALKIDQESGNRRGTAIRLNNIGLIYRARGDYDSALQYYKKALKIDQELGNRRGRATRLNNIGFIYRTRGDYDSALKNYRQALKIFEELGAQSEVATLLNSIGMIYNARGDYDVALQNFEKALKIDEELGHKSGTATDLNNIGEIYRARGDYEKALKNYEKALKIDEELGDRSGTATRLNNIGMIYRARGDYDHALKNYEKALKIDEELGDRSGTATRLNNIGFIFYSRGDYEKALQYYEKALKIAEELGDRSGKATLLNNIGMIYDSRGDYDAALQNLEKALKIDEELDAVTQAGVRLHNIGKVYYRKGEFKKALEYFERAHGIFEKAGHARTKDVEEWIEDTKKEMRKRR